ncbi:hypothetical protein Aple_024730 [Acrocarpospora pleiomorpha]|uniref:Uncharacterized protein n=1 Tax=Acrocarpospora pleiomorpha TaxID=90975 RepID=A0A5M3XD91_9ACTN|nr:ankyrin repeat domain-containing protein [Acrocarpospora pleiomorpha]GES19577.1 hypothetical protein Aple_024730 [Acrocarpospora pleiomorpha]
MALQDWTKIQSVRARLDAGADPNAGPSHGSPLHLAARWGSPDVVEELAALVDDVDTEYEGRTALWTAIFANRPENADILVDADADPWRPMMSGWSPGRLSLATPIPDMYDMPPGEAGLSAAEAEAVAEAGRLIAALGRFPYDGVSLACVAGVHAAEAVRRLGATPAADYVEAIMYEPLANYDESLAIVGVTDAPGGCVVSHPCGFTASTPAIMKQLSVRTVCYGMYANPKSGNQGSVTRDGVLEDWDTHPGGGDVLADAPSDEVLASYLYQRKAVAYCCARAGLRLPDARAIIGPPDMWVKLPQQDHWR